MGTRHFNISILVLSVTIMNKRQKIVGIVSLAILAIINFVIYGLSDMQTMYIKEHPSAERVLSDSHDALLNVGYLVLANYLLSLIHISEPTRRP